MVSEEALAHSTGIATNFSVVQACVAVSPRLLAHFDALILGIVLLL